MLPPPNPPKHNIVGTVTEQLDGGPLDYPSQVECDSCWGEGVSENEECEKCGGTGRILLWNKDNHKGRPESFERDPLPDLPKAREHRSYWQTLGKVMHYEILSRFDESIEYPDDVETKFFKNKLAEYMDRSLDIWKKAPLEVDKDVYVEQDVYVPFHEKYLKGRLDLYGVIDGFHAVLDLKVSPQITRKDAIQASLYAKGLEEDGHEVERGYIVSICPDSERADPIPKLRLLSPTMMDECVQEIG